MYTGKASLDAINVAIGSERLRILESCCSCKRAGHVFRTVVVRSFVAVDYCIRYKCAFGVRNDLVHKELPIYPPAVATR